MVSALDDVIRRLEAGESGREVDARINMLLPKGVRIVSPEASIEDLAEFIREYPARDERDGEYITSYANYAGLPRYTTSLDAAVSLVPEGWGVKAEWNMGYGTAVTVGHVGPNKLYDRPDHWATAATPALALCIAALKARRAGG